MDSFKKSDKYGQVLVNLIYYLKRILKKTSFYKYECDINRFNLISIKDGFEIYNTDLGLTSFPKINLFFMAKLKYIISHSLNRTNKLFLCIKFSIRYKFKITILQNNSIG